MSDSVFDLFRGNINAMDASRQKQLFLSFRGLVYRDIYFLLNDHALTEDVIQESFLKAIKHGPKTREGSNMSAWLRQISRNTAFDLLRKNKKYRQLFSLDYVIDNDETELQLYSTHNVEETVETALRDETLQRAMLRLKYEHRVVLFLHYMMDMSYAEISKELKISEQVLTQRLARARKRLMLEFSQNWGESDETASSS